MSNQNTKEIEKFASTFRIPSKISYESLVYSYSQYFELEIRPDKQFYIRCVCGKKFKFNENKDKRISHLADCPKCLELWHLEERDKSYLLIRPRTNAQIHAEKG